MPKFVNSRFGGSRYHPYRRVGSRVSAVSGSRLTVPRSNVFKKDVQTIAKVVANRTVRRKTERKQVVISMVDKDIFATQWNYYNPFLFLAKGTNLNQRVADTITDVYLDLTFMYYHTGLQDSLVRIWEGSVFRILVFKCSQEVNVSTVNNWQSVTANVDFPGLIAEPFQISNSAFNKEDYTLLYDSAVRSSLQWDVAGTFATPAKWRVTVPLAKRYVYKDFTGTGGKSYSKFSNIYVLVGASGIVSDSNDLMGRLQCSGFMYFRDA